MDLDHQDNCQCSNCMNEFYAAMELLGIDLNDIDGDGDASLIWGA